MTKKILTIRATRTRILRSDKAIGRPRRRPKNRIDQSRIRIPNAEGHTEQNLKDIYNLFCINRLTTQKRHRNPLARWLHLSTQLEGETMKRISMVLTAAAVMAATTFLSAPAQAGGIKLKLGNNHHRTVGHSTHHIVRNNHNTINSHKRAVVRQNRYAVNHSVCKGYYTNNSYQYWVNGYWQEKWVDTSRWVVDGLTKGGQANYVWVTDGYNDSYWVNGYWATGYNRVWVGDGCHRCRMHH